MLTASLCLLTAGTLHGLSVEAVPRRIILLRHAEKANSHALCKTGLRRSIALRHHYLGRNALNPSLLEGQVPEGIVAITLHTIETAGQTAFSWGLPIKTYAAMPGENGMIPLDKGGGKPHPIVFQESWQPGASWIQCPANSAAL